MFSAASSSANPLAGLLPGGGACLPFTAGDDCEAQFKVLNLLRALPGHKRKFMFKGMGDMFKQAAEMKSKLAEIQDTVGGAAESHFVIETGESDVVALAHFFVIVDTELGDDKQ